MKTSTVAISAVLGLAVIAGGYELYRVFFVSSTQVTVKVAIPTPAAPPPAQTVSYFLAHPDVLKVTVAKCDDDPGGIGKTANCVNADTANEKQALANSLQEVGS